jgi:hypothetical protein
MTGLIQRFRRRRAARPAHQDTQPTLPAGVDPQEAAAPAAPSFRDRGRLRRRLRYLRRVRELGFRDLGGLVFDLHRFGRPGEQLVQGKLNALAAVDRELRALETALNDRRPITELREPGIASCPRCGALHGSDARFCPACGVPFSGPRPLGEVGEGGVRSVGEIGAVTPAPAPAPAPAPSATAGPDPASPATGQQPPQPAGQQAPAEPASQPAATDPGDQPTVAMNTVGAQPADSAEGAGESLAQRADVREP